MHSTAHPKVPFQSIIPRRIWVILGIFAGSLQLSGCQNEEKKKQSPPTEPWLKKDSSSEKDKSASKLNFELIKGQSLQFFLPTKRTKPAGTISGISGHVEVNLDELTSVSGKIFFDLTTVQMLGAPAAAPAAVTADQLEWTAEAQNWLGLGRDTSKKERQIKGKATFELLSARGLSHFSAHGGRRRKGTGGTEEEMRQIKGTVEGDLALGGLSVHRQLPVTVSFRYLERATPAVHPVELEVAFHRELQIPLAEYEIHPRDSRGNTITENLHLLGSEVGRTIRVRGKLLFRPR